MSNAKTTVTVKEQLDRQRAYIAREFGQLAAGGHAPVLSGEGAPKGVKAFNRAGPYYVPIDEIAVRSDIAEGLPGIPLELRVTVLDSTRTRPIAGARVYLWQADSDGYYSGYADKHPDSFANPPVEHAIPPSDDLRFLRGVQSVDERGVAVFKTIYPGWYYARCLHIHIKVEAGGKDLYTGELFLPEEWNNVVQKLPPYNQHTTLERTPNSDDVVYQRANAPDTLVSLTPRTPGQPELGFTGSITVTAS
jgi:protocatechuate 3,4-dioxygenase beta subunit